MGKNNDIHPQIPNQKQFSHAVSNQTIEISQQFSGPLPSPKTLAEYANIYPGLEKIIVEMAQRQSEHRIGLENTVIISREKQSVRGQIFAFILAVILILLAGFSLYLGHLKIASSIVGFTLVSIVTLFLTGNSAKSKPPKNVDEQIDKKS